MFNQIYFIEFVITCKLLNVIMQNLTIIIKCDIMFLQIDYYKYIGKNRQCEKVRCIVNTYFRGG